MSTSACAPANAAGTIIAEARIRGVQDDARLGRPRAHGEAEAQVVEHDDVGVGPVQQRPERVPVGGNADPHDARVLVQDRVHARAGRGVMVEDDDADHAYATSRDTRGRAATR